MSPPRPAQSPGPPPGPLHGVLEPIVRAAGFELDQLDVRAAGRRHTVKLVVDGDSGVGLDDIARLSRTASAELDQHEHLLGGSYTLEVTSPGTDRPLTLPRHWRRAFLRQVAVRLHEGGTLTARVGRAGDDSVTVLVDGVRRELAYADVAHAAVQVEFRPPPDAEVVELGGTPTSETEEAR
ncbi:MAG: Bacterial ribosome SSU maturation protein RimP [uncultured Pseudonocardia sp.]|uniref:Ribosome maturation factor RimP n=1 Tax=uncultured Pseudonocardia sp. TaxID=211455 RepID=A0A6J4Q4U6_9PSEU|nr:MAG: Bacterial ribosome SSU maturation protein RimP [uncultured Pseudonocardia sp.]